MTAATDQLAAEVDRLIGRLAPFIDMDAATTPHHAERVVAELSQGDDDGIAAEACLSVMTLLWPTASPEHVGRADWWRSPLGRLCARSLGRDDTASVSRSVAAAMLGVTLGTVQQMMHRGTLDRHPDGGVLRASVLRRLGR